MNLHSQLDTEDRFHQLLDIFDDLEQNSHLQNNVTSNENVNKHTLQHQQMRHANRANHLLQELEKLNLELFPEDLNVEKIPADRARQLKYFDQLNEKENQQYRRSLSHLRKLVVSELRVFESTTCDLNALKSSNLSYYEALVHVVTLIQTPKRAEIDPPPQIWKSFTRTESNRPEKMLPMFHHDDSHSYPRDRTRENRLKSKQNLKCVVDVVSPDGIFWIKLRSLKRLEKQVNNPSEALQTLKEEITCQLTEMVQLARLFPVDCNSFPQVCIYVPANTTRVHVSEYFTNLGVFVISDMEIRDLRNLRKCTVLRTTNNIHHSLPVPDSSRRDLNTVSDLFAWYEDVLNLDISCLMAWCSETTNNEKEMKFERWPILNRQAHEEWNVIRVRRDLLEPLFAGRTLIACARAVTEFERIVGTVGGESERRRAKDILNRIQIVSDASESYISNLFESGHVSARAKCIFSCGLVHGATTVTSNKLFVQAAEEQGYKLRTFIHPSRALTEKKWLSIAEVN